MAAPSEGGSPGKPVDQAQPGGRQQAGDEESRLGAEERPKSPPTPGDQSNASEIDQGGAAPRPTPSEVGAEDERSAAETNLDTPEDDLARCLASHEQAQLARLSGGYVEATRQLVMCSRQICPAALRNDCFQWRREISDIIPTIIVVAENDEGDMDEASVFVDGELARSTIDGRPIALDPGSHVVGVRAPDGKLVEKRLVMSEGEQARRVVFDFKKEVAPPKAPQGAPPTKAIRPVPDGVYALAASSTITLGVAIGFGLEALRMSRTADKECSPLCDPSVSQAISERAAVSDVALGVSLASAVGAALLYVFRPERVVLDEDVRVDVEAGPREARLVVGGRF